MSRTAVRLEGEWREEPLGPAASRLIFATAEVYVLGLRQRAPLPAAARQAPHLTIEWLDAEVRLTLQAAARSERWSAQQALVHEPLPALYRALPLERFDARARRFWRRVFLIARLPGGRRILSWLARRR